VQRQLPLSVGELSGQGVEQFGRSEALVSGLDYQLAFLDHVHEFNTDKRPLGCIERFKPPTSASETKAVTSSPGLHRTI
jgi:hypothetical protein